MLVKLEKSLLLLAVLLFLFSTAVQGVASVDPNIENGRPGLGDGKGMEVRAVHDGEGYWLNIEVNKPQFKFKYISGDEVQDHTQFKVRFDKVVEYLDEDQNGVIDDGEELFEYRLIPMTWTHKVIPIEVSTSSETETTQVTSGWKVTLSTNTSTKNGLFAMNISLWLFEDEAHIKENGNMFTVDWLTIKIDLTFISIPWTNGGSKLALKVDLNSEYGLKQELELSSQGEGEVSTTSMPQTYFGWDNKAQIYDSEGNFVDVPVTATSLMPPDSNGINKLYLCYPSFDNNETLVHDPVIGVRTKGGGYLERYLEGYSTQLLIGVVAVVAVCVALLVLHRRKKAL